MHYLDLSLLPYKDLDWMTSGIIIDVDKGWVVLWFWTMEKIVINWITITTTVSSNTSILNSYDSKVRFGNFEEHFGIFEENLRNSYETFRENFEKKLN